LPTRVGAESGVLHQQGPAEVNVTNLIPAKMLPKTEASPKSRQSWLPFWTLLLVCFLGNYCLSAKFGLYDDDYYYTVPALHWHWHDFLKALFASAAVAPDRPLGLALNHVITYLSSRLPGLQFGYLLGCLLLTFNAYLVFRVLKPLLSEGAAFCGALLFLLTPADMGKQVLLHRAFVQGSITCLLAGILLNRSEFIRVRTASYAVAAASLFIWEGPYLPFLAAPFFWTGSKVSKSSILVHLLAWCLILGLISLLRAGQGDGRLQEAVTGFPEPVSRMFQALWMGPAATLRALILRPWETLKHVEAFAAGVGLIIGVIVWQALSRRSDSTGAGARLVSQVALGGTIAFVFPYVLMFRANYFPPNETIGRLSSLHAPSTFGLAVLSSVLFYKLAHGRRFHRTSAFLGTLVFGLLGAYGVQYQENEFGAAWEAQRTIWRGIYGLSGDAGPGTPIVVEVVGLPESQCFPSMWVTGVFRLFDVFVDLPESWPKQPRITGYYDWCETEFENGTLLMKTPPGLTEEWPVLKNGEFIFLKYQNDQMTRIVTPVKLFGHLLLPKAAVAGISGWLLNRVGRQVLLPPTFERWRKLFREKPFPSTKNWD
jgi:hypothetical protein